jgi:hypothetical protein
MRRRTRRSATEWSELVRTWADSGQSQTEFAQRHGLGLAAFRYWVAKRREASAGLEPMRGRFVAVVCPEPVLPPLAVGRPVVVGWGSLEVEMAELPPVAWLRQLVEEVC